MKRALFYVVFIFLFFRPFNVQLKENDYTSVINYFNEIALKCEYGEGNGVVKKWKDPINIYVMGNFTKEDYEIIKEHVAYLNSIKGIPQVSIVRDLNLANVCVNFITQWEMSNRVKIDEVVWGYAKCFWNENYEITNGEVFIVYDRTNQTQRHHIILEELTQVLGLLNDSDLYEDSIFFNYYSEITRLSHLDDLILRTLYGSGVKSGMRGADAFQIISIWLSYYYKTVS